MYLCAHTSERNALAVSGGISGDISGVPFAPAALRQESVQIPKLSLLECEKRPEAAC